jgi:very-short-patch-repair endonuclease
MSAEQRFKCEICGKDFKAITNTHLKKHGLTTQEYRLQFPEAIMGDFERFSDWRNSEENRKHCFEMSKKVYGTEEIRQRKAESCRRATQDSEYRKKHSSIIRKAYLKNPEKWQKPEPTEWMKKSNYERWVIQFGVDEANLRQKSWANNIVLPCVSKNTKPEMMFSKILDSLQIKYETQKRVEKYICDFYLPNYETIVEVDGDYWHANPSKFKSNDVIGGKKMLAEEIWANDDKKSNSIKNHGYALIRYWASELKNISHEKVFEDIVQASMKMEDKN